MAHKTFKIDSFEFWIVCTHYSKAYIFSLWWLRQWKLHTNVIWILLKVFNVFEICIFSTQFWPHYMTMQSCCFCQYVNTCQFTGWWNSFFRSWQIFPWGKGLLYGSLYTKNLFIELRVMQFCIMPPSIKSSFDPPQ